MAEIERGDVEILVRAGARSNKQDDARHRAMVEAYLDFEPATRRRIHIAIPDVLAGQADEEGKANSQLQEELAHSIQSERESSKSYRPDEEETDYGTSGSRVGLETQDLDLQGPSPQVMDSPALSFNGVLDNVDSPVFRGPTIRDLPRSSKQYLSQASSASWGQVKSVISDSQPEPPEQVHESVCPTTGLVQYLETCNAPSKRYQSVREEENQESDGTGLVPETLLDPSTSLPRAIQSSSPGDLPSSPSPPKPPSRRSQRILQNLQNMSSSQNPVAGSKRKKAEMIEESATSSSPPRKLPRSTSFPLSLPSTKAQTLLPPERSSSQAPRSTVQSTKTTEIATSSAGSSNSPWANQLHIRASPPTTSSARLTAEMLITQSLESVLLKMSKDIPFKPMLQTRELRGLERGHWIVDCQAWNDGLRIRSWDMLGNFVGRDLAGWGVSCERSEDRSSLRVNCWGVMVRHIYYLIFLASEGKVKLGSADWIGGDGVAIIKMP